MVGLTHLLWIGGAPVTGKTTIATRLARRHGLRVYSADTRTWEHRDRAIRDGSDAAIRWEAMTPDERWATSELVEMSLHYERGPMVVDDLRALPRSPLVVAEGSTVPAAGVQDRSRAVWLIPTADFHQVLLDERGITGGPRELYAKLAEVIEREAVENDVPILRVDDWPTVETVERLFEDALAEGPVAESVAERRALLREANDAIVAQVRGYYARPWADGDPDEVVRAFVCECGEESCDESVEVSVGAVAAAPVLAAGHG